MIAIASDARSRRGRHARQREQHRHARRPPRAGSWNCVAVQRRREQPGEREEARRAAPGCTRSQQLVELVQADAAEREQRERPHEPADRVDDDHRERDAGIATSDPRAEVRAAVAAREPARAALARRRRRRAGAPRAALTRRGPRSGAGALANSASARLERRAVEVGPQLVARRRAPSRPTATAGSSTGAARRSCGSPGRGRASPARRGARGTPPRVVPVKRARRVDDLGAPAVVEGDEEA